MSRPTHLSANETVSTDFGKNISRRQLLTKTLAGPLVLAAGLLTLRAARPAKSAGLTASKAKTPRLKRGGSIHTMMNWADLKPGSKERFAWPPFSRAHFDIPTHFLEQLAATGIDFVRMTVDQGPFLQAAGRQKAQLDRILLAKCKQILNAGLNLVVDIHPVNQVAKYHPDLITKDINGPLFKQYASMVGHVAGVLKALDPARVVFEPFNEPPYGYQPATLRRWQKMMEIMHAAIRAKNPDITIIWSGAKGGGIDALMAVQPERFPDKNIIWTFHYYTPHFFTHQGVRTSQDNMLYYRYLSDLPYPAGAGNIVLARQTIEQNIMVDNSFSAVKRKALQHRAIEAANGYIRKNHTPEDVRRDFGKVVNWANKNNIPANQILLGEFGVVRRSEQGNGPISSHRNTWLRAVREAAEQNGFGWAIWDINQPQMGIVLKRDTAVFDTGMLRALGLKKPSS